VLIAWIEETVADSLAAILARKNWDGNGCDNQNNRDDNQQFDQREAATCGVPRLDYVPSGSHIHVKALSARVDQMR